LHAKQGVIEAQNHLLTIQSQFYEKSKTNKLTQIICAKNCTLRIPWCGSKSATF